MISFESISVMVSMAAEVVFWLSAIVVAAAARATSVMVMSGFFMIASEPISVVVSMAVEVVFGMAAIVRVWISMVSVHGVSWLYELDG